MQRAWVVGLSAMATAIAVLGFRCPGDDPQTIVADGGDPGMGGAGAQGGFGEGGAGGSDECGTDPDVDDDLDGYTENEGDCDDCNDGANPQAVELPTADGDEPVNEDCDGEVDETLECDAGLLLTSAEPNDGARAMELCKVSENDDDWGLLRVEWTRADGAVVNSPDLAVGMAADFGDNILPQRGERMLVLSTGHARDNSNDPNPCGTSMCSVHGQGTPPVGFPQQVANCETGAEIWDDIALQVQVRAPSNVGAFSFQYAFASFEFPDFVCTPYNDQFIALVMPPPGAGTNLAVDAANRPVGTLMEFIEHCDPAEQSHYAEQCMGMCPPAPAPYCPEGTSFLERTGFNAWDTAGFGAGATGWLQTTAPIDPGDEITLRFAIYDVGDAGADSTVWVDAFQWHAVGPPTPETSRVANPN